MRIVLVGQGSFGEKVLEALLKGREEVAGTFSPPDKRGEGIKVLAEKSGVPFLRPNLMKDPQVYDAYKRLEPDLAMLAFVTDIIPEKLLTIPTLGTICYHPSLLPRHRGASAINWAIIQGETRTGLTLFWVDKGIDTGPILLQKEVEIGPDDTAGSLYFNILFPMGVGAMVDAVEMIKKGKAPRIPQDDSKATYEPPCDDRVASVDFGKPVKDLYNFIRGCDPQPGAYMTFKGRRVRFYDAKMSFSAIEKQPGEIIDIEERSLQVAVKDGIIQVGKLRVDGGEKIGPVDFVKMFALKIGDQLGR
jgi:methionyl-tRNA formyltransferase